MDPKNFIKAIAFAAHKHRGQRRKDRQQTPYINHPIALTSVLALEAKITDETVLVAALLHDTVEDTSASFEELEGVFGSSITGIVRELSDDKSLPKSERKRLQIEHARHASTEAKCVKLADKICNVRDITHDPPADWPDERRQEYLDWAESVVAECRGVSSALEEIFDKAVSEGRSALGLNS